MPLFEVQNLTTDFHSSGKLVRVIDEVNLQISSGQVLALVGESGCGKSVLAHSMTNFMDPEIAKVQGLIQFDGQNLSKLSASGWQDYRGKKIAMIFQDSENALSPVFSIGYQLEQTLQLHFPKLTTTETRKRALELFERVGLPSPKVQLASYPHQLSGGMKQRVMIAFAICAKPKLLIADEPTSALDVTVQSQILELLKSLAVEQDLGLLLITHNFGVVAQICDSVAVMYSGKIVEQGTIEQVFRNPRHPYTKKLLDLNRQLTQARKKDRLISIPGSAPDLKSFHLGCRFRDRCQYAMEDCGSVTPKLKPLGSKTHLAACFHPLPKI